ncbi:MAG: NUDIX hydrolase [Candidatus Levybacteria bacterium]|nr:NUDIX hydrolase [Candidatus Levybacteria bacterium]
MHKVFYASGFLYHEPTQQILLQQAYDDSPEWSLIGGVSLVRETAEEAFYRIVFSVLRVKLSFELIYPVYTYNKRNFEKKQVILYADIDDISRIRASKDNVLSWFSRKQIQKLPLDPQTRQDLIVGHRVIDARMRKSQGIHVLE